MDYLPSLELLPVEILYLIFDYLEKPTLYTLTQVCRHLQYKTERVLYKSILLKNKHGLDFAKGIERIPVRATYIRELKVHYHQNNNVEDSIFRLYAQALSWTIDKMVNLRSLALKDHERQTFWVVADRNLQRMRAYFGQMTLYSISWNRGLHNLQSCTLQFDSASFSDLGHRDAIFFLPNLKSLTVIGLKMATFPVYRTKQFRNKTRSTALKELNLLACFLSPNILHKVLSIPKALERFTCCGRTALTHVSSKFSMEVYMNALREQKDSLVAIYFDLHLGMKKQGATQDISSLKRLKTLEISGPGKDLDHQRIQITKLPRSLECLKVRGLNIHFSIQDTEKSWISFVENQVKIGVLPMLRTLIFEHNTIIENSLRNRRWYTEFSNGLVESSMTLKAYGIDVIRKSRDPDGQHFPFNCACCELQKRDIAATGSWFTDIANGLQQL